MQKKALNFFLHLIYYGTDEYLLYLLPFLLIIAGSLFPFDRMKKSTILLYE